MMRTHRISGASTRRSNQSPDDLLDQPNVVEEHRPCTAGNRAILRSKANGKSVDVGKIHAGKFLQLDDPLVPPC